jgi:hypothetical protein
VMRRVRWYLWILAGVLLIYIGGSVYFMDHFFLGTTINGEDAQFLTVSQADNLILKQAQSYQLTLQERNGDTVILHPEKIGVSFYKTDAAWHMKRRQSGFYWPKMFWEKDSYQISPGIQIDDEILGEALRGLECVQTGERPINAWIELTEDGYGVHKEEPGSCIDVNLLADQVEAAVLNMQASLNLDTQGCYMAPGVTEDSEKIVALRETLDHWLGTQVTYEFGPETEVIDRETVASFIDLHSYDASLDQEAIAAWVAQLAEKRDTYKRPRNFKSTLRGTITVKGGNYGWEIDQETESALLLQHLENGDVVQKEPAYLHTGNAWSNNYDIGDTYIEVDLSAQHMWFYKEGELVIDTDVVTGNMSRGWRTPEMVSDVKYKARNAVLRGVDYATPVKYWVPFYRGYGIHDANWRGSFGGAIYQTSGSHGCVNTPTAAMKVLYENVEKGTPVVLYY